jgi:hypothetical protein
VANAIAAKKPTVAQFIAQQLAISGKTQREVAIELGYGNANIISMFKLGVTKLPLNKVGPLAKALEVEPYPLLELVMHEYMPETWEAIGAILPGAVLSPDELELVQAHRRKHRQRGRGSFNSRQAEGKQHQTVPMR